MKVVFCASASVREEFPLNAKEKEPLKGYVVAGNSG